MVIIIERQQLLPTFCLTKKLQLQDLPVRLPSSVKNTENLKTVLRYYLK